jgi:hypothetical protein
MAWKHKRTVDTTTSYPTGMPTYSRIASMVKQIMNASQYDYHESEAFEVKEVILNEPGNRGSVKGTFINNPNQEILGGVVKPLMPNVVTVPVVGEHVVAIEYNGQHYYTSIINRKGSINENSIPGASGTYEKNTKYGKTFERKNVKPLQIGEGCVLYEGRFGQSIHFDSHKNKPSIKIRTNIDESEGAFTTENIDTDDSSIYLTSDGLSGTEFDGEQIKGKKILIKSDGIFINGRDEIRLNSDEIKISNGADQSVVRGEDLKKFLDDMLTDIDLFFTNAMATIPPAAPGGGAVASPVFKAGIQTIKGKLEINTMLSNKVKTS